MKLLISLCVIFFLWGCNNDLPKTEQEVMERLLKDTLYTRFNQARETLVSGIIYNQWGNLSARDIHPKDLKNAKNFIEIKNLYKNAGVTPGCLTAFNTYLYYQNKIKNKYIKVIKENPAMFMKVMKELTLSTPLIDAEKIKKLYVPQTTSTSQKSITEDCNETQAKRCDYAYNKEATESVGEFNNHLYNASHWNQADIMQSLDITIENDPINNHYCKSIALVQSAFAEYKDDSYDMVNSLANCTFNTGCCYPVFGAITYCYNPQVHGDLQIRHH